MTYLCEGYHHFLRETTCIVATWHEDTGAGSISEPVLTTHVRVVGPGIGCLNVHDKSQHPYHLGVSSAKTIYDSSGNLTVMQVRNQTLAGY